METIDEIKPLVDALDFIKFTDRAIGNKFVAALKALQADLRDAEGGPYEPSSEAEEALTELSIEISDALEKLEEEEEIKEEIADKLEDAELDDEDDDEDEDLEEIETSEEDEEEDSEVVIEPEK